MRELEFLPEWYPQIRRRRRGVLLQAWITFALVGALGTWLVMAERNVEARAAELAAVDAELSHTREQVQQLDELLVLQKQLGHQDLVLAQVGSHVEATRLLKTLEDVMPPAMSLLDLVAETEERLPPPPSRALSRQSAAAAGAAPGAKPQRRLRIRLIGLAPSDVDLANFLAKLTARKVFEEVAMTYARDRQEGGHVMREFELTFSLDLDAVPEH